MLDWLLNLDTEIFNAINQTCSSGVGDAILPHLREKIMWYPFYIAMIVLIIQRFRRKAYIVILSLIAVVGMSDQISSNLIKPSVQRVRPCNEVTLSNQVLIKAPCRGSYSFTSSHAVNHFAVGTFLFMLLPGVFGRWRMIFFVWAGSISVSQVYVGLHYPLDIGVGALIGIGIGWIGYQVLSLRYLRQKNPTEA